MKYQFYCKQAKVNKMGKAPIEMSISINGQRRFINLGRLEYPKVFKEYKDSSLRSFISLIEKKINDALTIAYDKDIEITIPYLINAVKSNKIKPINVIEVLTEMKLSTESYKKYRIILKDLDIENILLMDIKEVEVNEWIKNINNKFKPSTASSKVRKIKSIFEYARKQNYIEKDLFNGIKIKRTKPIVEYLTEEEINIIRNKDISIKRLEQVKDLFLFQCGTGLSYADIKLLSKEDLINGIKNGSINKARQKTNIEYISVLLPMAKDIILKYDYELPIISNQKMNAYLKEIADVCGISKNLHSHLARKTYATLLLNRGVKIEAVSKTLGHSNIRITQECYAHLLNKTIIDEVLSKI